jgi:hypothetical protein
MLAMTYRGPLRVHVDRKIMPEVLHPRDAIVCVTRSCICGSDPHLHSGDVPDTRAGMTFGQGSTGVVEENGDEVEEPKIGDLGLSGHELRRTPTPRNSSSCIGMGLMRPRGGVIRTRERTQPSWWP